MFSIWESCGHNHRSQNVGAEKERSQQVIPDVQRVDKKGVHQREGQDGGHGGEHEEDSEVDCQEQRQGDNADGHSEMDGRNVDIA